MRLLDTDNPLLSEIQSSIKSILLTDGQTLDSLVMTNERRHSILKALVTYSDTIPHPTDGMTYKDKGDSRSAVSTTLVRWQILAYVASIDLTIAKWFESHLDALSILHELGHQNNAQGLWAIWAAEGHPDPLRYQDSQVNGTKAWCSGAHTVDHALVTYRDEEGNSQLLTIDMHQPNIHIHNEAWQAVGMQDTDTATVRFDQAVASPAGSANAYLDRTGFWHGAAGVAACWYGATTRIAAYLVAAYQRKPHDYKAMYLGQVSIALSITHQYFCHVAELIDTQPHSNHELAIRQLRANVEQVARRVIEDVGQALGAAPFCTNAHFARLTADLPVFIRQSHGAFDLQKIGELSSDLSANSTDKQENIWQL